MEGHYAGHVRIPAILNRAPLGKPSPPQKSPPHTPLPCRESRRGLFRTAYGIYSG
jgi:hypothetical protein